MKKVLKYFIFGMMAMAISMSSCSKDGETGPAGPAGLAGTNGANGTDGTDGTDGTNGTDGADGTDGNANVVSVLLENQEITTGTNNYDFPELTQSIFDSGVVFAYVTVSGNDFWETLPLSSGGDIILEIDQISVGSLVLRSTFTQSNLRLRFIFVESSSLSGKSTTKNIKKMSYKEAMDYFGFEY